MARYLIQASYTSDSLATQVKNPTNRLEAVAVMMASVGSHLLTRTTLSEISTS